MIYPHHSVLLQVVSRYTPWYYEQITQIGLYPQGLGIAPWEEMPQGEACAVAQQLQQSLMGRLIPVSRFCLISDNGLHYSEGIAHPDYKSGVVDTSVAVDFTKKVPKLNQTLSIRLIQQNHPYPNSIVPQRYYSHANRLTRYQFLRFSV
jgi:hypothetical protein